MTEPRTRAPRRRAGSPLAVVSAALASFLVVLALLTARVVSGTDPSLRPAAQTQLVAHNGKTVIRTTASGRRIVESVPAGGKAATTPAGLVSRTSGGGESDG